MPRHPMSDALAPKTIRYRCSLNHTLCRLDACKEIQQPEKSEGNSAYDQQEHSSQHCVPAVNVLDFTVDSRWFFHRHVNHN